MSDRGDSLFKHYCDQCTRFATNRNGDNPGDWYVCNNGGAGRSVIYRYGNEGSEYASSPLAGYACETPLISAALIAGLRLTEAEVRDMLGGLLSQASGTSMERLRSIMYYLDPDHFTTSEDILTAVKKRPGEL